MRWIGAGTVIGVFVLLSGMLARPYRRRLAALDQWIGFLDHLQPAIGFSHLPLLRALAEASTPYPVLKEFVQRLKQALEQEDREFSAAFEIAVNAAPELWEEDKIRLKPLGQVLGQSDVSF
ncbi:MAG: stage III sporulation protein AB, partial [Firmicutes bacterium]|nr:stage III sporulation protein AB [Bacillota bacterium]